MTRKNRKQKDPFRGVDRELVRRVVHTGAIIRPSPALERKVFDVVSEFAQPLLDTYFEREEDGPVVMGVGCLLWNAALLKAMGSRKYSESEVFLMETLGQEPFLLAPDEALNLISAMLRRWEEEFFWCRRFIMDWSASVRRGRLHLSVVSTTVDDLLTPGGAPGN